jgi:asparagine synthase (glutamine-hydrolysing)
VGGIIGKLSFEHDEPLARPVLEQMLASVRHRGPVGSGIHVAPGIALGWCGDHPAPINRAAVATNTAETVRVVADAALTNASQLRVDLERRGHVLHGRTDADLIAHAYDEWGDASIEHLRGPFACAIWDDPRQRLLLARDGIGIRPLFFAVLHGHGIVFASEIRALLQDPGVGREWCAQAIDAYLALGYVPAPLTIYQRISKVEPAQRLIVEGRRLHIEQYWELGPGPTDIAQSRMVDALESQLHAAVHLDLSHTSTGGVLYSGGLASTALLATTTRDVPAITMDMGQDADDRARTRGAATQLGFSPVVEMAAPDISAMAQRLATHLDEPFADPSAVSQYSTFLAARLHVTTAVAGQGAATLWPRRAVRNGPADDHARRVWDGQHRRELYTRGFAWEVRQADPFARYLEFAAARAGDVASDQNRYAELRTSLPDSTIVVAERAAAAAGLQLRFPFLARDLVELAAAVPVPTRRDADHPLRLLLARSLPPSLMPPLSRPPQQPWLSRAVAAMVPGILLGRRFDGRGIVSRLALQRLWDDHAAGRRNHSHRLWSLLMLEFWFREFVDGDAVDEPFEYAILRAA